ncbi:hypothetical protein [Mycobacterium sp. NPDC050853]|uniref:hypothetical protein n=1 Tax=Mycobacterium sp. NPDC050853 TaxID=3155160 RepID=UPI0033CE410A
MYVGIRTAAVAAVCSLCVGTGVDVRTVRSTPSVTYTATTRSVTTRPFSLTALSDLLAVAVPQNDAVAQSNSAGTGVASSTDLMGTVAKLLTTSKVAPTSLSPELNAPAADAGDLPVGQPADPPAADEPTPPTNFPGPRPTFGTPSYFAQLAFAVFHVVALPITVPVQFFLGSAEGVSTVIAAALNDLSGLLGEIPGLSPQQPAAAQPQQKVAEVSSPLPKLAAAETDPPADEPPPAPDPLPTNFPGPRPAFGTPSYFAQLAFAVLHVLALPITVPVQAIIGKTEGVPTVIVAALNDLSSLLGQVPKLSAPAADTQTTPETSLSQRADQAATKPDAVSEKSEATKRDAAVKTAGIEHTEHGAKPAEASAEAPKTEHEAKPVDTAAEAPKVDPTKVVEPKVDPTKAVEPKVDPATAEAAKPEATKPEVAKPEVTKPEVTKPEVTKPEVTKPEAAKPEVTHPVKVIRDSLKSAPGDTSTTGGTKTAEGSKGAETDSKAPAASTVPKVREGLTSSVGGKTDKPAEKPSTEKSSPEKSSTGKGASSSEGTSHSSEGKSHSASTD